MNCFTSYNKSLNLAIGINERSLIVIEQAKLSIITATADLP